MRQDYPPKSYYLDNAATSYPKPPEVVAAMVRFMETIGASPGRSAHRRSLEAARLVFAAREAVAELFHIPDSARIIFTPNATAALNLALFGFLTPGSEVVLSGLEHNSVMRPLMALERQRGIRLKILPGGPAGQIDPAQLRQHLRPQTKLIVINHASNVTGTIQPLSAIRSVSGAIPLLVDAAQSAGVVPIDVIAQGIDMLAFSGHKGLFGPPGTGGLYVRAGLDLAPLIFGGTGSNSEYFEQPGSWPDRFESGTPNSVGLAGLLAGVRFVLQTGLERIAAHERELTDYLTHELAQIAGVTLWSEPNPANRIAVLSCTIAGLTASRVAARLDREYDIAVRVGLHCSPLAHKTIGTFPSGTIRLAPGYFQSLADMVPVIAALRQIAAHAQNGEPPA
jgi:cysteine desulfurase family protein